ncbi:MAG: Trk system potassium transporter TrkA [Anaerovoracaceae bacterium]|jgi:trk system potassium uptake protein TrkA
MDIIIVGCGKIGATLAEKLSEEEHNITVIDLQEERVASVAQRYDVLGIRGNGSTIPVLNKAGAEHAELLIAVTQMDELNILSCMVARKLGAKNTIARVRNPEYMDVMPLIKGDSGLSMSINPEKACADEMVRVLRLPSMTRVETFPGGDVDLLEFMVSGKNRLIGMPLKNLWKINPEILVCLVTKKTGDVVIPSGEYVVEDGDKLIVAGKRTEELRFLAQAGIKTNRIKSMIIVGGGRIGFYLARMMVETGVHVKIIERDRERCMELIEELPDAEIIHGDGTDQQLLTEEGVTKTDAFASLTGMDEENIMLSLFVQSASKAKLLTKVTHNSFSKILRMLNIGSTFSPRLVATENILRFVRAMKKTSDSSEVQALFRLEDDKAEAMEFLVGDNPALTDKKIKDLNIRDDVILGVLRRRGRVIIPRGDDTLQPGDSVAVITTGKLDSLKDIIK